MSAAGSHNCVPLGADDIERIDALRVVAAAQHSRLASSAAERILSLVETGPPPAELRLDEQQILADTPRAAAVAMFRNLADRLESGDLDGARVQWRVFQHHAEIVTVSPPFVKDGETVRDVKLLRIELMTPERPTENTAAAEPPKE